jgi:anti-sigma factor RsiW
MTNTSILVQLNELASLDLAGLRERWQILFGSPAPQYSRSHLVRRLAHRLQVLQLGDISDATRSALRAIAEKEAPNGRVRPLVRRDANDGAPVPGTVFTREWHGKRHEVTALGDGGFDYRGQTYRSLSAIAKVITGQHWNGKLFFGLTSRKKDG